VLWSGEKEEIEMGQRMEGKTDFDNPITCM